MVELENIIREFAHTEEDRAKLAFHMQWTSLASITEEDVQAYPFYAIVKRAKQQYFRELMAERIHEAERRVKAKSLNLTECIQVKTRCLERAHTLGVCL